jgi:hypothetical protein
LTDLRPYETPNRFPYGNVDVVALHVASTHRGVPLDGIDFCFGGSTLGMLASCDSSDPYMVTRVPGTTGTLLVVKSKEYVADYTAHGFQFERLMTGIPMDDMDAAQGCTEHLHVVDVGGHRVLFRAETDALLSDGTGPVEIKASNPRYWGTKVMFQMISSGSPYLCHGTKRRGDLVGVTVKSLQEVSRSSIRGDDHLKTLEQNILRGMESLRTQMADAAPGDVFKVSFDRNGSLQLLPVKGRSGDILPPPHVVQELIGRSSK